MAESTALFTDRYELTMIDAALRLFDAHAEDGAVHLIYRTRVFHARPTQA